MNNKQIKILKSFSSVLKRFVCKNGNRWPLMQDCTLQQDSVQRNVVDINLWSFTLIEILVVATIIGLLASGAAVSYSRFVKTSRDARRKTDLEQIRSAIEQYKSDIDGYPPSISFSTCSLGSLSSGGNTYMSKIPNDPDCTNHIYYYVSSPANCDNSSSFCSDYTVCTYLETGGTNHSYSCGNDNCNYCLGPYGEK